MRIKLLLSRNTEKVPYNYQENIVSAIHGWIGRNNDIHDSISLYSFSWLQGGLAYGQGIDFPHGAFLFISAHDVDIINKLIIGANSTPNIGFGLQVMGVEVLQTPNFESGKHLFKVSSPIFVKRQLESREVKHYGIDDNQTDFFLTETLQHKLRCAGIKDENAKVSLYKNYAKASSKLITYKGIQNKCIWCPVFIYGASKTLEFAWNVGIGNCTGIGFGSIY